MSISKKLCAMFMKNALLFFFLKKKRGRIPIYINFKLQTTFLQGYKNRKEHNSSIYGMSVIGH